MGLRGVGLTLGVDGGGRGEPDARRRGSGGGPSPEQQHRVEGRKPLSPVRQGNLGTTLQLAAKRARVGESGERYSYE